MHKYPNIFFISRQCESVFILLLCSVLREPVGLEVTFLETCPPFEYPFSADHRVAAYAVQHPAQHVVLLDHPGLKPECVRETENLGAGNHRLPLFAQPAGHHSRQRVTRCRRVRAGSSFALPAVNRLWQAVIASAGPPRRSRRKPSRLKTAPLPSRSAVAISFWTGSLRFAQKRIQAITSHDESRRRGRDRRAYQ